MGLVDTILNIAALLLWLNWRSAHAAVKSPLISLAATVKKADPRRGRRWMSLATLLLLLGLRSFFYWNVGTAAGWTPSLELGVISLPFRSDYLPRMLLYSCLSFGLVLGGFYTWLLLLSVVNGKVPNDEPLQRLVRLNLGFIERWPPALKLLLPAVLAILLWGFASPALVRLGIVPAPASSGHVWQQALLVGLAVFLTWKLLLVFLCVLYLVNSYVYLGKSYFWNYVNVTGANLLGPVRRLPLCIGKVDLSPLVGMLLILVASDAAAKWLPRLYQRLPFF
jgi:uncharacterized protein YggT (Ycf19 family)